MECKSRNRYNNWCGRVELIDTLWNVNYYKYTQETYGTMELIDTLWNVNTIKCSLKHSRKPELIDTLWNVNVSELVKGLEDTLN